MRVLGVPWGDGRRDEAEATHAGIVLAARGLPLLHLDARAEPITTPLDGSRPSNAEGCSAILATADILNQGMEWPDGRSEAVSQFRFLELSDFTHRSQK